MFSYQYKLEKDVFVVLSLFGQANQQSLAYDPKCKFSTNSLVEISETKYSFCLSFTLKVI